MAKRKDISETEEEEAISTSEEERPKKKPASKGKATAKKPVFDDDSESEEERPIKKKKKVEKAPPREDSPEPGQSAGIKTNYDGEKYVELGKKKRVTVRSFKGIALIDIREFYGQEGDEKPGKKGIALSPEQWEAMKANMDNIDTMLRKLKK